MRRTPTVGHKRATRPTMPSTVRIALPMLLNSRSLIQRSTLACTAGGGAGATSSPRTKPEGRIAVIAASPLDRSHTGIVPVHQHAGGERKRQVNRHRDGDDLDGLSGLIERGPDDPRRLWEEDEPQQLPAPQAEREPRLALAARHRQDAGPHDFGDEGGRIS